MGHGGGIQTLAVHAGEPNPRPEGAAVAPIFQTTTFLSDPDEDGLEGYHAARYTRCNNNPSQGYVAAKLAVLEGAEAGLVLSSGMAAISNTLMALLKAGDHMLLPSGPYGGTHSFVTIDLPDLGVEHSIFDVSDPDSWEARLRPNTRVIYCEAISNPLVAVAPLRQVVEFARKHGLKSVVDATFATPVNLRALDLGFDAVVHSCTKYLNGHSDVIAGVVLGSASLVESVRHKANHLGGSIDPHAAFLLNRGLKTLPLRVHAHCAGALALARALEGHPQVTRVYYPGLESHPDYALARDLFVCGRCGGVLAFEVDGGAPAAMAVMRALKLAIVAVSLGSVETLVTRPATTTHGCLTPEQRAAAGIADGMLRVAVGIEDPQDLVDDFLQALDAAAAGKQL